MLRGLKILRANEWYSSKATGLAGLLFLITLVLEIEISKFIWMAPLSFATLVGIAGLGYLINDLSDMKTDLIAGKRNFINDLKKSTIYLVFFLVLLLAFLPWAWLPKTHISFGLITLEIILFGVYSFKPFRLKEQPFFGLLMDSLYAHVLPAGFAFYTFWLIADKPFPLLLFSTLLIWQFFVGLRNIIQHHLTDRKKDKKSSTYNFYNDNPLRAIKLISKGLLLPELALFGSFCFTIPQYGCVFFVAFLVFLINQTFTWRNAIVWRVKTKLKVGLASPSFFYEHRLGILSGVILSIAEPLFIVVTLIYIFLFGVNLKSIIWGIKSFYFKVFLIPIYRIIIQPWYKYVVHPFHSVVLKYAYHYGHKLKLWLGIAKNQGN